MMDYVIDKYLHLASSKTELFYMLLNMIIIKMYKEYLILTKNIWDLKLDNFQIAGHNGKCFK